MGLRGWLRKRSEEDKEQAKVFQAEIKKFRIGGTTKKIIVLPEIKGVQDINITYPLISPYSYARITWDDQDKALLYSVEEPHLTDEEKQVLVQIQDGLSKSLEIEIEKLRTKEDVLKYLQDKMQQVLGDIGAVLRPGQYTRIMYYVYRNSVGLNQIEPLMHDSYIEDIGCDGNDVPLFITHKKYGNVKTNIIFNDKEELQRFVVKLAERGGRYISYAEPLLDGTLPDGSRVNATLASDVTTQGPTFSIRKFSEIPYSAIDLCNLGTTSTEMMAYFWYALEHRKNILVVGGTGAGKTSFLNSIVSFIPPEEKIISIEDTRELNLQHENWLPAVARVGFGAVNQAGVHYGEVTLFDLLKESFRQNPDYVIVGEVRGVEASVLFQGMASGHSSLGTMHGGSVDDVLKRMETPPISLSPSLLESLDIVVVVTHATTFGKSSRRVKTVAEIIEIDIATGKAKTNDSFTWLPTYDKHQKQRSFVLEEISREYGKPLIDIENEMALRTRFLDKLKENKTTGFKEVSRYLSGYYKNKQAVLKELGLLEEGTINP